MAKLKTDEHGGETMHHHAMTDAERAAIQEQAAKDQADAEATAADLDRQASEAVNRAGQEQAEALAKEKK